MGRIVVVAYKAKPGMFDKLKTLMEIHRPTLKNEGLVTNRDPIIMLAKDETIIEVFEWKSKQAIEDAHNNPAVQEMWGKYFDICDFIPAAEVAEFSEMFSEFPPLN